MNKVTIELTEDQAEELKHHLISAKDFSIYPEQKAFLQRILDKLAKARTKS